MARKNNKGFSIVEIIIAIAILSLLLVPIVNQISQTFRTSRMAKKQQYVNDSAVYLMEEFQKGSLAELEDKYGAPTVSSAECMLYDPSGAVINDDDGNPLKVDYTYMSYSLSNEKYGADDSEFNRAVSLDDLTLALKAAGYKPYVADSDYEIPSNFQRNSEDNIVMYFGSTGTGPVAAMVCEPTTAAINPNSVNLGNMQNLDSTKVAIIPGSASNFDAQADMAFFSLAMENLKKYDYDTWQQAITHVDSESVLTQSYNLNNTLKLTLITIKSDEEGVTPSEEESEESTPAEGEESGEPETKQTYTIKADVYYYNSMTFKDSDGNSHTEVESLNYNVFSQKFYTTECPAIYMEYQPYTTEYVKSAAGSYVTYTTEDYIMVDNYVNDAKIYLYKPFGDQMNVVANVSDSAHGDGGTMYKYYQELNASGTPINPVTIHICNANNKGFKSTVYTNIDTSTFDRQKFESLFPAVVADDTNANTRTDYSEIKELLDDTRESNRLYTINVTLTPADDNAGSHKVSLTGAKGEN